MHIYEQLGVRRVINAYEHLTRLGGSIMDPEVLAAMTEASQWYIDLDQLQERVGQRIAARIGVEAAYVTGGAAAGLLISAAACIAGTDPARITRLPDTRGMRNEIVVERSHRNRYDHALRQVGATFVEYGYARGTEPWELEAAITPQTAAVAYCVTNATPWSLPLPTVATIAHRHGLPVIVDAAAELPPAENLRRFVDEGGDLVVFSGGKGLRGPQPSGLILGRRDLIVACQPAPHDWPPDEDRQRGNGRLARGRRAVSAGAAGGPAGAMGGVCADCGCDAGRRARAHPGAHLPDADRQTDPTCPRPRHA
jgi:D-glucosaminate-6-phosphate ammonia-lyase